MCTWVSRCQATIIMVLTAYNADASGSVSATLHMSVHVWALIGAD